MQESKQHTEDRNGTVFPHIKKEQKAEHHHYRIQAELNALRAL